MPTPDEAGHLSRVSAGSTAATPRLPSPIAAVIPMILPRVAETLVGLDLHLLDDSSEYV